MPGQVAAALRVCWHVLQQCFATANKRCEERSSVFRYHSEETEPGDYRKSVADKNSLNVHIQTVALSSFSRAPTDTVCKVPYNTNLVRHRTVHGTARKSSAIANHTFHISQTSSPQSNSRHAGSGRGSQDRVFDGESVSLLKLSPRPLFAVLSPVGFDAIQQSRWIPYLRWMSCTKRKKRRHATYTRDSASRPSKSHAGGEASWFSFRWLISQHSSDEKLGRDHDARFKYSRTTCASPRGPLR